MQWQLFTAVGIGCGYVADLALYYVPDSSGITGLNWRLMMGSAGVPAVFVCACCYIIPESPRWYLTKNRHIDAYKAMCQLRFEKVQAARDLYYASALLEAERETQAIGKSNRLKEFFTIRRNRNAMVASQIVMVAQQLCGVNIVGKHSFTFPFVSELATLFCDFLRFSAIFGGFSTACTSHFSTL